jgi:hypothetical protein
LRTKKQKSAGLGAVPKAITPGCPVAFADTYAALAATERLVSHVIQLQELLDGSVAAPAAVDTIPGEGAVGALEHRAACTNSSAVWATEIVQRLLKRFDT